MKCPRCNVPLQKVDYEGVETDMCDQCWGFWLDTGELEQVLDRKKFVFSEKERKQILDLMSASDQGPTEPAPCPRCGETMERFHYDESVHLVIDRCDEHGVWLDTGEIKKVQAVAETSGAIHRMLLRKLGALAGA
jgi:Zn-finger nucleic acid-binding protein